MGGVLLDFFTFAFVTYYDQNASMRYTHQLVTFAYLNWAWPTCESETAAAGQTRTVLVDGFSLEVSVLCGQNRSQPY